MKVTTPEDVNRLVYKAENSVINILESDVTLCEGDECFETVKNLLLKMYEQLSYSSGMIKKGTIAHFNYLNLLKKMKHMKRGTIPFTIEIDDPVDQSFIERIDE